MGNGITNGDGTLSAIRLLEWLFRLITAILIPILFLMWGSLQELKLEMAETRGNRYTSNDHIAFSTAVWAALSDKANNDAVPPAWFLDEVRDLEDRVRELERNR